MKTLLMTLFLITMGMNQASANPTTEILHLTQKDEIQNDVHKNLIIDILAQPMVHARSKYYAQHYKFRDLGSSYSDDKRKIWIVPSHDAEYTHIIKIQLRNVQVEFDHEKRINTTETYTYAIKAGQLMTYSKSKREGIDLVKLLDFQCKVK